MEWGPDPLRVAVSGQRSRREPRVSDACAACRARATGLRCVDTSRRELRMKSIHVLLCCALSAFAGALLCYAVMRTPDADIERFEPAVTSSVDSARHLSVVSDSAGDVSRDASNPLVTASPANAVATSADNTGASTGDTGAQTAPRSSGAGPMPMSDANLRRAEEVIADMRLRSSDVDDLYMLLDNEGRDPDWSDAAEAQLAAFLRTHGGGYHGLEVKPPRCSARVCEIVVVARPGLGTEDAHANWQRLLGEMFSQPWFRNGFVDERMGMTLKDGSPVYVTNFVRAEPAP
ncbi:hypothetical protein [Luteimonas fraxinea]|uniref:hypothetical protein n=1 Tax=Luteimonas fraxinea TaxID=2901869 RepID=UPI001E61AC12|nr:hypothetical protein [Luteimonas fraxinea]